MYRVMTFKEVVRIPPKLFGMKISEGALEILREQYERTVDKTHGIIVSLHNASVSSKGKVLQGDGAVFCEVEFDALVFTPEVNEVIEGEITEIVEFGAFVRMGPIDGLVHVSQVANEFLSYDKKTGCLVGKQSKKNVKKGDLVKAKIATVSLKDSIPNSKIALTMRPDGLGKKGLKSKDEGKKNVKEKKGKK